MQFEFTQLILKQFGKVLQFPGCLEPIIKVSKSMQSLNAKKSKLFVAYF